MTHNAVKDHDHRCGFEISDNKIKPFFYLVRHCRDEQILFHGLPEKLGNDLDLLASRLKVGKWNTRHSGHLHVVDDAHQFVQQPEFVIKIRVKLR